MTFFAQFQAPLLMPLGQSTSSLSALGTIIGSTTLATTRPQQACDSFAADPNFLDSYTAMIWRRQSVMAPLLLQHRFPPELRDEEYSLRMRLQNIARLESMELYEFAAKTFLDAVAGGRELLQVAMANEGGWKPHPLTRAALVDLQRAHVQTVLRRVDASARDIFYTPPPIRGLSKKNEWLYIRSWLERFMAAEGWEETAELVRAAIIDIFEYIHESGMSSGMMVSFLLSLSTTLQKAESGELNAEQITLLVKCTHPLFIANIKLTQISEARDKMLRSPEIRAQMDIQTLLETQKTSQRDMRKKAAQRYFARFQRRLMDEDHKTVLREAETFFAALEQNDDFNPRQWSEIGASFDSIGIDVQGGRITALQARELIVLLRAKMERGEDMSVYAERMALHQEHRRVAERKPRHPRMAIQPSRDLDEVEAHLKRVSDATPDEELRGKMQALLAELAEHRRGYETMRPGSPEQRRRVEEYELFIFPQVDRLLHVIPTEMHMRRGSRKRQGRRPQE